LVLNVRLGTSVQGRLIEAYVRGRRPHETVLVVGGVHGDEPKSVSVARRLIDLLCTDRQAVQGVRWVVIPVANPDGYERRNRRNAHGVDINRNFPTRNWRRVSKRSRMFGGDKPAGEPETRTLIKTVTRFRPARIIVIHSISNGLHCNNYDGPARALAAAMSRINRYPVRASMGYPTPGSFGTWAGAERNIPIITLELPSRHSPKRCWEDNRAALLACALVPFHR
jgi:protein MpaA